MDDCIYRLSIACIFRDGAFYLKEWIEFHLLLGVEHFYLANHLSVDHFDMVLAPYIKSGVVELISIDIDFVKDFENEIHIPFMNKLMQMAKHKTEWLALIDVDEFITPKLTTQVSENTVTNSIYDILQQLKSKHDDQLGGVALNWVLYGHANVKKLANDEFILERLNKHAPVKNWTTVKCIVIPQRIIGYHVHKCSYVHNYQTFSMNEEVISDGYTRDCYADKLWLSHYNVGDSWYFNKVKILFYLRYLDDNTHHDVLTRAKSGVFNDEEDNYMKQFAIRLRSRLTKEDGTINLYHHNTDSVIQPVKLILYGGRGVYKDVTKIALT